MTPEEVARVAEGLTRAHRQARWLCMIVDNGPDGIFNTPIPWNVLAALRRKGLCKPSWQPPYYMEVALPLGLAVRTHLEAAK